MSTTSIEITALSKRLKSAVNEFELVVPKLTINQGEFVGLVGKSGSGKSTLLDILAMVSEPTSVEQYTLSGASCRIDLAKVLNQREDQRIARIRLEHFGYILQSGGLFEFLTVRQNLELPSILAGVDVSNKEMEASCAALDIAEHLDKKPSQLSGGQRQRVAILRALVLSPTVVLADEPTASVDESMSETIVKQLKRLSKDRGTSVIMVSHDLDLVKGHADRMYSLTAKPASTTLTISSLNAI